MKKLVILTALLALSVPAVAGSTQSERSTKTVGAFNNVFKPKSVKVKRGTKVTWVIRQGVHNVRSKKGSFLVSNNLTKGRKYSKKFTRKGTYSYTCTLHPGMDGKVVVR
jgi:plastocyanin